MDLRRLLCLAMVVLPLALASCAENTVPPVRETPTRDPAALTLVPYADQEMGIQGLVPAGWVEFSPGQVDNVLRVSAGVTNATLFASVFARDPIRKKVKLKETAKGVDVEVDGVLLRFRSHKKNLALEEVKAK